MTEAQLLQLADEIANDPNGVGYAVYAGQRTGPAYEALANLLNTPHASVSIEPEFISVHEVMGAVDPMEYLALSSAQRDLWRDITNGITADARLRVLSDNVRAQIAAVWGAGTASRAALVALQTRAGSPAEGLFGRDAAVTALDVGTAQFGENR